MSESFGAKLRHERERRKIDLRSIAEDTKIGMALLEGLERDDVKRWPSGIFRKSFIRSYAGRIGLDPDEIARQFLELYPDPADVVAVAPAVAAPPPAPPKRVAFRDRLAAIKPRLPRFRAAAAPAAPRRAGRVPYLRPIAIKFTIIAGASSFTRGAFLNDLRRRCAAAACDVGVSCALAAVLFPVLDRFWTPLGVSMALYYVSGILILGNTPGVCLFAPAVPEEEEHARLAVTPAFLRRES